MLNLYRHAYRSVDIFYHTHGNSGGNLRIPVYNDILSLTRVWVFIQLGLTAAYGGKKTTLSEAVLSAGLEGHGELALPKLSFHSEVNI